MNLKALFEELELCEKCIADELSRNGSTRVLLDLMAQRNNIKDMIIDVMLVERLLAA